MIVHESISASNGKESCNIEFQVDCTAIDTTNWYTYPRSKKPDKKNRYYKGVKPERGSTWAYQFITLVVIDKGKKFSIGSRPVFPGDNIKELAKELLIESRDNKRIIKNLLADKGFFRRDFRKLLDNMNIKYVIPVKREGDVKKKLKVSSTPMAYPDFEITGPTDLTNLVIVEGKGCYNCKEQIKFAFSTNIKINNKEDIKRVSEMYPGRWTIETIYRIQKQDYLPKTTSKDFKIRLFYFLYSELMYNIWCLIDSLVWIDKVGKVGTERTITSRFFRTIYRMILADPG